MAVAFRASATSTAATITIPAGAAEGDYAFLFQQSADSVSTTEVFPSGWSQGSLSSINTGSAGSPSTRWNVCYKKLEAGDPGASITGMDGNTNDQKIMVVFSGVGLTLVLGDIEGGPTNTDPASQTCAASGVTAPVVVFGVAGCNDAAATFSTASPAFDSQLTAGNLRVGYKLYTSSPADHTIDKGDEGGRNYLASFYAQLIEAQDLAPALVTGTPTVPAATVAPGSVDASPGLFTGTASVYTAVITQSQSILPGLFTGTLTTFAPTVTPGAANIAPTLATFSPVVGAAIVAAPDVFLTATLITNSATIPAATVLSTYPLTVAAFASATFAVYTPAVSATADILPTLATFALTTFTPTVVGENELLPPFFTGAHTDFAPTVSASNTLEPSLVVNTLTSYLHRIIIESISDMRYYVQEWPRTFTVPEGRERVYILPAFSRSTEVSS